MGRDKPELLKAFMQQLPDGAMLKLTAAVEMDKASGGEGLPHEMLLEALRPRLRNGSAKAPRIAAPLRLVCEPFEDMLINGPRRSKQPGRILRATLAPMWKWLRDGSAALVDLEKDVQKKVKGGDAPALATAAAALRAETAAAIRARLGKLEEGGKAWRALEEKLGGPGAIDDVREIALLLEVAPQFMELRATLPRHIARLSEEQLRSIRGSFDKLTETNPAQAPYLPLLVLGRLERPWEALRLTGAVSRQIVDTMVQQTDMGMIGDVLFADLETEAEAVRAVNPHDYDPAAIVAHIASFVRFSGGLTKELGIRKDGKWGQRLLRSRSLIGETIEALLAKAPKDIQVALPTHRMGGFGAKGPRRPDVTRPPDAEKSARARRVLTLLSTARPHATQAAFTAAANDVFDEVCSGLRLYNQEIVNELRAASPETKANVEAYLALAAELTEIVMGEQESGQLRRRAAAGR